MDLTPDGHVLTSGIKRYPHQERIDRFFGLVKARVDTVVYVDDIDNKSYARYGIKLVEYVCRIVGGQYDGLIVKNVVNSVDLGGKFNYSEKICFPLEELPRVSGLGDPDPSLGNGDYVLILFMYGDPDSGVIIRGFPHPQATQERATSSDGRRDLWEFNGWEHSIDKDGNYSFEFKGLKEPISGEVINPIPVGTKFEITKDGVINIVSKGLSGGINFESDQPLSYSSVKDVTIESTTANVNITGAVDVAISGTTGKLTAEGSGGKLKLEAGQVGLGSATGEIVEELEKQLIQLDSLMTGLLAETHLGNLGYPTGTPINSATYTSIQVQFASIKTVITALKGGI